MPALKYVDIWNRNRLPLTTFNVGLTPYTDWNLAVNGISLPSWTVDEYDSNSCVNLLECNKDWLPFFSSIKTANNFFNLLRDKFEVENPWDVYGIIFAPLENRIYGYEREDTNQARLVTLGSFYSTINDIKNSIKDINSRIHKADVFAVDVEEHNPKLGNKDTLDWGMSGTIPFYFIDDKLYEMVKKSYSQMYGYQVSEIKVNN